MRDRVCFPDAATELVPWLRTQLDPIPVHSTVPAVRPERFVRLYRAGGVTRDVVTDAALIAVECWGDSDEDAHTIARDVRSWLLALRGPLGDTVVQRTADAGGPASVPDPDTGQARVQMTFEVTLRGASCA